MTRTRDDNRLAINNTNPQFKNANCKFHREQIPKAAQQRWKGYLRENNMKVRVVWENFLIWVYLNYLISRVTS